MRKLCVRGYGKMRSFLAAIQFLTVIPVHVSFSERDLGRSVMFFPLTGLLMGAVVSAADFCIKGHIFPLWLASTIDIVILAVLSGGLHLDGLADSRTGCSVQGPETGCSR